MKGIYTILFLVFACSVYGQVPALLSIDGIGGNGYDHVSPRVVKTIDGGFILTFYSSSTNGNILCNDTVPSPSVFRKYNADGTIVEWVKCHTGVADSAYDFLFPTPDGNFVLGGHSFSMTSRDFLIRKEDSNGNIIWGSKKYGGTGDEFLKDMIATDDGGYIMLGESYSNDGDVGFHYGGMFNEDIWVLKVDSDGNKIWDTIIGGTDDDFAYSLALMPDGGCYILGGTASSDYDCTDNHGNADAFIVRLSIDGAVLWHRCIGGSQSDGVQKGWLSPDGKGGVLIVTDVYSADGDVSNHIGNTDFWIVNIDSANNILWNKCYGSMGNDLPYTICMAADRSIWAGGGIVTEGNDVDTAYGDGDAWVIHTDSAGNLVSAKVLGSTHEDAATVLQPLTGGAILAGGYYDGPGNIGGEFPSTWFGSADIFLARLAPWTTEVKQAIVNTGQIAIYPNPATDIVHISNKNGAGGILAIINAMGQIMIQEQVSKGKQEMEIDTKDWAKGLYLVRWQDVNGGNESSKLLCE